MFSGMVNDDGPEGRLPQESIVNNALLMLFAGHETTVNLIAHSVAVSTLDAPAKEVEARRDLWPAAIHIVLPDRGSSVKMIVPSRGPAAWTAPGRLSSLSELTRGSVEQLDELSIKLPRMRAIDAAPWP